MYRQGEGTAVIVMAEIPGITPAVASFARRVVARGHTVYLPHLFGDPGAEMTTPGVVAVDRAGVRRHASSRRSRCGPRRRPSTGCGRSPARPTPSAAGPGVGAVGHVLHRRVRAGDVDRARDARPGALPAVAADRAERCPSCRPGMLRRRTCSTVTERARDDGLCVLGLRFTGDRMVPGGPVRQPAPPARATTSSVSRSTRRRATPGVTAPWPTRCSPRTSSTSPGSRPVTALEQVLDFLDERLAVGD